MTDSFPLSTELLLASTSGDPLASEQLFVSLYDELRKLAKKYLREEGSEVRLSSTDLVHEAYLRMVRQKEVDWKGRTHFFAIGARQMRRILVDQARARSRQKRGGRGRRVQLLEDLQLSIRDEDQVLALDEILGKLEVQNPRFSRIVELRFFGGMTVEEVSEVLQVSKRTVEADWTFIRAWLRKELAEAEGHL
jgi:RNA polymerase sigma factor (TIGR02999 family)